MNEIYGYGHRLGCCHINGWVDFILSYWDWEWETFLERKERPDEWRGEGNTLQLSRVYLPRSDFDEGTITGLWPLNGL